MCAPVLKCHQLQGGGLSPPDLSDLHRGLCFPAGPPLGAGGAPVPRYRLALSRSPYHPLPLLQTTSDAPDRRLLAKCDNLRDGRTVVTASYL